MYNGKCCRVPTGVPAVYDESLSIIQQMGHIIAWVKDIAKGVNGSLEQVEENEQAIARLEELFEKFQESGFDDYYREQIHEWVQANMEPIISDAIKMVWFGLTDDGRFCAFVPQSWNDIVFDTGAVYGTTEYGRLILKFNSDGTNIIDNTPPNTIAISSLISTVESLSNNIDKLNTTNYTPIKKGE